MGLIEKWNDLARKKIYINDGWEISVGRIMYMIILNGFIMLGMLLSGTTAPSLAWLWADMIGSFRTKKNGEAK